MSPSRSAPSPAAPPLLTPAAEALLRVLEDLEQEVITYSRLAAMLGVSRHVIGIAARELYDANRIHRERIPTENGLLWGRGTPYRFRVLVGSDRDGHAWTGAVRAVAAAEAVASKIGPHALSVFRRFAKGEGAPHLALDRAQLEELAGVGDRRTAERALTRLAEQGLLAARVVEETSPKGRRRKLWLVDLAASTSSRESREESGLPAGLASLRVETADNPSTDVRPAFSSAETPYRSKVLTPVTAEEYRAAVAELWHSELVKQAVQARERKLAEGVRLSREQKFHLYIGTVLELQEQFPSEAGGAGLIKYALEQAVQHAPVHFDKYVPTVCTNNAAKYLGMSTFRTNGHVERESSPVALRERVGDLLYRCAGLAGRGEMKTAHEILEHEVLPLTSDVAAAFFEGDDALAGISLREAFKQGVSDFVGIEPDLYGFDFFEGTWSWPDDVRTPSQRRNQERKVRAVQETELLGVGQAS